MKKILDIIRGSLSLRLGLWILLFAVIIFSGALNYMFRVSRETVRKEAINRATQTLNTTVLRVNNILQRVQVAVNNTDWVALGHLDSPDSMFVYTRHFLKNNPEIYGASLAFEPNYYKEKGYYFSAYSFNQSVDSLETSQEGSDQYQYFCMDWYLMPKLLDRACWTEAFIDLDVDSTYTKEMLISYCKPLKDAKGQFIGVMSADISVGWLSKTISAMRPYPNSYNIMVGKGGTFFVHPDSTMLFYETIFTRTLKNPHEGVWALGKAMQAGEEGMRQLNIDGDDFYVFYEPLGSTGWSVAILCPESDIFSGYNRLRRVLMVIFIVGLLLMLFFFRRILTNELKPLEQLALQAETIASGRLEEEMPDSKRIDEIGKLSQSFSNMQHSLVNYIEELKTTTAQKASIESELNVAKNIQMSMLPKTFPPFPDCEKLEVYGKLTSAKEVGGDLFDFYIRDNKFFFCIGDVSGKGVPASLLMTVARSQFRSISGHQDQPDRIVIEMNDLMVQGNESLMFVTLFVGRLDLDTGHLAYCCAGHNPPVLVGPDVGMLPVEHMLPVGIMPGLEYILQEMELPVGTILFLYTDGLTEAMNGEHQIFDDDRMIKAAQNLYANTTSPRPFIEGMVEAVNAFVGSAPQSDDMTMLAIKLK